jgi:hypothetical protein
VFYISAIIYALGGITYWSWASGEQQYWAQVQTQHQSLDGTAVGDDDPDEISERRAASLAQQR